MPPKKNGSTNPPVQPIAEVSAVQTEVARRAGTRLTENFTTVIFSAYSIFGLAMMYMAVTATLPLIHGPPIDGIGRIACGLLGLCLVIYGAWLGYEVSREQREAQRQELRKLVMKEEAFIAAIVLKLVEHLGIQGHLDQLNKSIIDLTSASSSISLQALEAEGLKVREEIRKSLIDLLFTTDDLTAMDLVERLSKLRVFASDDIDKFTDRIQ